MVHAFTPNPTDRLSAYMIYLYFYFVLSNFLLCCSQIRKSDLECEKGAKSNTIIIIITIPTFIGCVDNRRHTTHITRVCVCVCV